MKILVWAGLFLVLAVVGSAVGAAGMLGMPISTGVESAFLAVTVLLIVWGVALFVARPRLVPALVPATPMRRPAALGDVCPI